MNDEESQIESILRSYCVAAPDKLLRQRVLRQGRVRWRWNLAQGVAAALLIGLNLMQIAGSLNHLAAPVHVSEARTQEIARAIARLDLPVPPDETRSMAQQLAAGENLVSLPLIHGKIHVNDIHANDRGVLE